MRHRPPNYSTYSPVPAVVVVEQNPTENRDKSFERKGVTTMANIEQSQENENMDMTRASENLENTKRAAEQTRSAIEKISDKIAPKTSHTMKIVSGAALVGGIAGYVAVDQLAPKASLGEKMGGAALGSAGAVAVALAVDEMLENRSIEKENSPKKKEEKN